VSALMDLSNNKEDEWIVPLQKLQGCYNINANEDDDPRNVNIA
jgi:hypothetical protein